MKKNAFASFLKMPSAAFLLFILSYFFNPLNDTMRNSLTGPISVLVKMVSPDLLMIYGRFLLLALFVGLPGLLLGTLFTKHAFFKTGLFSGAIVSAVSVINFILIEKGEQEAQVWFVIAPFFALVYFLMGFAGGGFWGFIGKQIFRA